MNEQKQFFNAENMQKFLADESYLEIRPTGEVDFCLGKTVEEASQIFKQYLNVQKGRQE